LAAEKTGTSMKEMRLIYAGKDLSEETTMKSTVANFGLQNNCSTFIVYRLRGGSL